MGRHNFAKVVKTRMGAERPQVSGTFGIDGENVAGTESQAPQATQEAFDIAFCAWAVPSLEGRVHREQGVNIDDGQL